MFESLRTASTPLYVVDPKTGEPSLFLSELDHACKGIVDEAGELTAALKKGFIYGKPIDKVNLIEEAGDSLWYFAMLFRALGTSFEEVFDKNIAKLKVRYPDKFTSELALNRDLLAERRALEDQ